MDDDWEKRLMDLDDYMHPLAEPGMDDEWLAQPVIEDEGDDSWVLLPEDDQEEEFYVQLEEKDLSCCHEEWEDYC